MISAAGCVICANQASNYSDLMKLKKEKATSEMVMESLILKKVSIHPMVESVQGKMLLYHFFAKDLIALEYAGNILENKQLYLETIQDGHT